THELPYLTRRNRRIAPDVQSCLLQDEHDRNPEERAGWLSWLFFLYVDPLISLGHRRPLTKDDIWDAAHCDNVDLNTAKLQTLWNESAPSMTLAALRFLGLRAVIMLVILLTSRALNLLPPLLIERFLQWYETAENASSGWTYAVLLVVCPIAAQILMCRYFHLAVRTFVQIRAALSMLLYRKMLKCENADEGNVLNLVGTDAEKTGSMLLTCLDVFSAPIQIGLCTWLLYETIGVACFSGFVILLILLPLMGLIVSRLSKHQHWKMGKADARVKLAQEMLSGMRALKFFAWEFRAASRVTNVREEELREQTQINVLNGVIVLVMLLTPVLITLVSLCLFVWLGGTLTVPLVFRALALFEALRMPLFQLPSALVSLVHGHVSARRVARFLQTPVCRENSVGDIISATEAKLIWSASDAFALQVDFSVDKGELVALVGAVGSGKTSLLHALLGGMQHVEGRFCVPRDRKVFVAQRPWLQHMSVRDNILFGLAMRTGVYQQVIYACGLVEDLRILPHGDATMVGDKGITLSGGQKQRVSLARATYAALCHDDDVIVVMDDPLSALDAHVAASVFMRVLHRETGLLRHCTRVVSLQQLQFLPHFDQIVVLDEGKTVGTDSESFAKLMHATVAHTHVVEQADAEFETKCETVVENSEEEIYEGNIDNVAYLDYWRSMGSFLSFSLPFLVFILLGQGCFVATQFAVSFWAEDYAHKGTQFYASIYAILALCAAVFLGARALLFALGSVRASRWHHERILQGIAEAPVSLFDTMPIGRIINRFSKDIDCIDTQLPVIMENVIAVACFVAGNLVAAMLVQPPFVLATVAIGIIYLTLQRYFSCAAIQVQRIESISRTPLYCHFQESVQGLRTIRTFQHQQRFCRRTSELAEANLQALFLQRLVFRWCFVRIGFINGGLIMAVMSFLILGRQSKMRSSLAGVAINSVSGACMLLGLLVVLATEMSQRMNATERVRHFAFNLPREYSEGDKWNITEQGSVAKDESESDGDELPRGRELCIRGLCLRYRQDMPLALDHIDLHIRAGEHVGICGRTGSGKSSLMLALTRLYPTCHGVVLLDGKDTSSMPLQSLRSSIAVIPQDSFLFEGTLRENLDPFNDYEDRELRNVLQLVQLEAVAETSGLYEKLGTLSQGQRQLLCIARALLKRARVILMDEATSAVDSHTDAVIQEVMREHFAQATVLTVAHRLGTIVNYDRICVLNEGRVVEIGEPQSLLLQVNSHFRRMLQAETQRRRN
ncbi:MAG: hypothetical protein MHM6MM_003960, partial [Cercozoa sp. M6MM]